jgi:hypothetical protein
MLQHWIEEMKVAKPLIYVLASIDQERGEGE